MREKIDPPVPIGKDLVAIARVDGDLIVRSGGNPPVALGSFLAHTHGGDGWDLDMPKINRLLAD